LTDKIKNIISQGENEQTEFKQTFNRQAIETLVAFANSKGGNVIIGVSNDKSIIGIKITTESIQNWQNEIKSKTEPAINPDIKVFTIEHKNVICISVQEYPVKPVALQDRYYVRKNNSNHLLSANEINELYVQSIQTSWDSYTYADASYSDLDEVKITNFIEKVNSGGRFRLSGTPKECLQKLRLIKNDIPTNAAMLMFSKKNYFTMCT